MRRSLILVVRHMQESLLPIFVIILVSLLGWRIGNVIKVKLRRSPRHPDIAYALAIVFAAASSAVFISSLELSFWWRAAITVTYFMAVILLTQLLFGRRLQSTQ
jgi:cation transport ATPase